VLAVHQRIFDMIPSLPVVDSRKSGKTAEIPLTLRTEGSLPGSVDGNIGGLGKTCEQTPRPACRFDLCWRSSKLQSTVNRTRYSRGRRGPLFFCRQQYFDAAATGPSQINSKQQ